MLRRRVHNGRRPTLPADSAAVAITCWSLGAFGTKGRMSRHSTPQRRGWGFRSRLQGRWSVPTARASLWSMCARSASSAAAGSRDCLQPGRCSRRPRFMSRSDLPRWRRPKPHALWSCRTFRRIAKSGAARRSSLMPATIRRLRRRSGISSTTATNGMSLVSSRAPAQLYTPERMARGMADIYARVAQASASQTMAGAA